MNTVLRKGTVAGQAVTIVAKSLGYMVPNITSTPWAGQEYIVSAAMGNYSAMTAAKLNSGQFSDPFGNGYFLKTYAANGMTVIGITQGHPDNPFIWVTVVAG